MPRPACETEQNKNVIKLISKTPSAARHTQVSVGEWMSVCVGEHICAYVYVSWIDHPGLYELIYGLVCMKAAGQQSGKSARVGDTFGPTGRNWNWGMDRKRNRN